MRVTGVVDNINRDLTNTIYVTLKGNDFIGSVQCFFADDYVNEASQLRKDQTITVKGVCEGKLMNVMLRGCKLE